METHDEFSERIRREQQIDARVRLATQLRVGAIEFHEEMIVITIRAYRGRRWKKNPILEPRFAGHYSLSAAMPPTADSPPRR